MNVLKNTLMETIAEDTFNQGLQISRVTAEIVKDAVKMMKAGKSDVSGSYTSDVFLNAPDILYQHLALTFQSYLVHMDLLLKKS